MLVLSRKTSEKIHIGNDIVITVTQVKGNRVKIGIDAPTNMRIIRGELKQTIEDFLPVEVEEVEAATVA
ncbi:MAG: carbon storage regulator [Planctomycetales bacterium]